jgi:hypothetical protein
MARENRYKHWFYWYIQRLGSLVPEKHICAKEWASSWIMTGYQQKQWLLVSPAKISNLKR